MAMPSWDQFMAPVLRILTDGQMRQRRDLHARLADDMRLTTNAARCSAQGS